MAEPIFIKTQCGRSFIGRFHSGDDLLGALTDFCKEHKISLGVFNIVGAVKKAKLGYYDQVKKEYTGCAELNKKLEIASCMGNVSLKDGGIVVHAHISLADFTGAAYGGHLMPDTEVFAAEFFIQELTGGELSRGKDPVTGLPLWIEN